MSERCQGAPSADCRPCKPVHARWLGLTECMLRDHSNSGGLAYLVSADQSAEQAGRYTAACIRHQSAQHEVDRTMHLSPLHRPAQVQLHASRRRRCEKQCPCSQRRSISFSRALGTKPCELREAAQPDLGSQMIVCVVVRDLTWQRIGSLM